MKISNHNRILSHFSVTNYIIFLFLLSLYSVLFSCSDKKGGKNSKDNSTFVINEIMTSNRTGLMSKDGNLYDWIEIKNMSDDTESLEGYSLTIEKYDKKEQKIKRHTWFFPEMDVKPGGCILLFASKKGKNPPHGELHTNFKLPADGGKLQLSYDEDVLAELAFPKTESDECYKRLSDGKYEKSYEASPGFDNTREGYEKYSVLVDGQRKGPLRIWEAHTKGHKTGNAWVAGLTNALIMCSITTFGMNFYTDFLFPV